MTEASCSRSNSNVISKSTKPFIQIDSICIDLVCSDDKIVDPAKCDHFSIRGFVSEMRKKDWKMCWPFSLDGNDESNEQKSLLPPLDVPHFNWWQCQNCRREISAKGSHQAPNSVMTEGRIVDHSNSTNLSNNSCPSCSNEREKKTKVADSIVVAPKSRRKISKESCQPGNESHEIAEVEAANANLEVTNEDPIEHFGTAKQASIDNQHTGLTGQASDTDLVVEKAHNTSTVRSHSNGNPSVELDDINFAASVIDEIAVGNDLHDHYSDKSSGLHRRKTRKVRLLTELLGENGSMKNKLAEIENSPSNGSHDKSAELDMNSLPPCQVSVQGIVRSPYQNRKRKLPQDEEWRPRETSSLYKVNKDVQALMEDAETTGSNVSNKFEDPFSGTGLKAKKRNWSEGSHTIGRKKSKKSQVVDPCLSILHPRETFSQGTPEKLGDSSDGNASDNVSPKKVQRASLGRWLDPISLADAKMEPKPNMCEKKSKAPEVDERLLTPFSWDKGMLKHASVKRKDVCAPIAMPFQSAQAESGTRGLPFSFNTYLAAQRYERESVPQAEDGQFSILPQQGCSAKSAQVTRRNIEKHPRESITPFKSPDSLFGQGLCHERSSKMTTHEMPFLNEKQNLTVQVEDGRWSRLQQMGITNVAGSQETTEVPECLSGKKIHKHQMADKVREQEKGALDDIPMEIVELMAKNQYERCAPDAENSKRLRDTNNSTKNAQVPYCNSFYSNGDLRLLQKQESCKQKPKAKNQRKFVESSNQNSVDYFSHIRGSHFDMNHLPQTHNPAGYSAFVQSQKKPSSGFQFSATGSRKHGSAQSFNCGVLESPGSSRSRGQVFGGWDEHLPVPQEHGRPASVNPQMILNHLSFGYNVPQKGEAQVNDVNGFSYRPGSMHKGNMSVDHDPKLSNQNDTNLRRHTSTCHSEAFSRKNAVHPFSSDTKAIEIHQNQIGSLDLCSNETIPAMHLLSLMDAGMQSKTPFTSNGLSRFPEKPPFHHNLKAKQFPGMDIILSKNIDTVRFSPTDSYSRMHHMSEKPQDCFPVTPALTESSSPFHYKEGFQNSANPTGQVASKPRKKEKTKRSVSSTWNSEDQKTQKCILANGGMKDRVFPVQNSHNAFFDSTDATVLRLGYHTENFTQRKFEGHDTKEMLSLKRTSETGVCSFNKNPADFSIPEAGNAYMIGSEDLKPGKRIPPENWSGSVNLDKCNQPRNMKCVIPKEHVEHNISW